MEYSAVQSSSNFNQEGTKLVEKGNDGLTLCSQSHIDVALIHNVAHNIVGIIKQVDTTNTPTAEDLPSNNVISININVDPELDHVSDLVPTEGPVNYIRQIVFGLRAMGVKSDTFHQ